MPALKVGKHYKCLSEDESNRIGCLQPSKVLSDRKKANDGIVVIEEYYGEAVDVLMEMYSRPAVFLWTFMETSGGRSFTRLSSRFSGPNPQSAGGP
jgi:hypothetical protein